MSHEEEKREAEKSTEEAAGVPADGASSTDGEFKLTVRKLEMPVRPRGVLAE